MTTNGVGQPSESWLDHKTTLVWMGRRAFGRRSHRVLGITAGALLILSAALFSVHAYATATIRDRALGALQSRLGRAVVIDDVDIGLSAVSLSGISIDGIGSVDRVVVSTSLTSLISGDIDIRRFDVYGVDLSVTRTTAGTSLDDVVATIRQRKAAAGAVATDSPRATSTPLALHDVSVRVRDELTATDLTLTAAHLSPDLGGGDMAIVDGGLTGQSEHRHLGSLLQNSQPRDVGGIVSWDGSVIRLDLEGGFERAESERYGVAGRIDVRKREAELRLESKGVVLGRLSPWLRYVVSPELTTVDAKLEATVSFDGASVRGLASFSNLGLAHRRVATAPIENVDITLSGGLEIDREAKSARITNGVVSSRGVDYDIELFAQLPDEYRGEHPEATLSATLSVEKRPCQTILDSIPAGFVPDLQGFKLEGQMGARVDLAIDWASLKKTTFESDLLGADGINNCKVVSAPERVSAERLRGSFEHTVPVGATTMTFIVGPESDNYVPLEKVSRNLTRSLITTEDSRFYRHNGFITKEFRTALIKNLEKGRFAYGASSISMQVVKNVMLARKKTISRKLEELFLTWYMERELDKDRILEIYVNAIEFGPGIYGIKPAAKRYFNKHPRRLNPVESAFFSSILPSPVRRFKQYCRGWAGRWTKGKIDRILDIMLERNRLDEDQYWMAIGTPLIFRGSRKEICHDYEKGLIGAAEKEMTQ